MVVISHGDVDGIICTSLYLKAKNLSREHMYFTSPAALKDALCRAMLKRELKDLFIFDLSGSRQTLRIVSAWERATWIDHHAWRPEERFENVEVVIKQYPSAAQVVAEYFGIESELVSVANEIDTNSAKSDEAIFLRDLIGAIRWRYFRDKKVLAAKLRALSSFLACRDFSELCNEENVKLVEEYRTYLEKSVQTILERVKIANLNGCKVAVCELTKFFPIYYITNNLLAHEEAPFDVIGILVHRVSGNGITTKVELRSHTGKNVLEIAKELRGGGHPSAAGATLQEFFGSLQFIERVKRNLEKL